MDEGVQGLVMNPAGFNYAGYALRDCVLALPFPYIEVHMSNVAKRGITRVLAPVATGVVFGFGVQSYVLGLEAMLHLLRGAARGAHTPSRGRRSAARQPARRAHAPARKCGAFRTRRRTPPSGHLHRCALTLL
ncbi:MAG: type II 3-dehydroquinate dehydratase [Comamonadaceae bacterium]|nr:type II 3-dehydroquinate dehydratase [Comamonadaceae bacterium]